MLVTKVFLRSLQCVCLLPKFPLKASQMRGHLNTCHQSVPFLSPNIPMLIKKFSPCILILICILIVTEVTKLSWNNSGPFTVSHMLQSIVTGPHRECREYSSLSLFTLRDTRAQCNQSSWIYAEIVQIWIQGATWGASATLVLKHETMYYAQPTTAGNQPTSLPQHFQLSSLHVWFWQSTVTSIAVGLSCTCLPILMLHYLYTNCTLNYIFQNWIMSLSLHSSTCYIAQAMMELPDAQLLLWLHWIHN